jgi:adenylate cyclase
MTFADERRLVTILFADMVGFTGRSESSDPEAVREIQRVYFAAVSAEIERFGGTVEKYIGDAVMATFGAPQAHDDDAERALRAALGIRDAVGRLVARLEVRIGINSGEVVGGGGSGPHAGEYTVTGDAVNVAARLQQAAAPDQIVVGAVTRRLAAEAFEFAPLYVLTLKGRVEGVEAWALERELPERRRLRGGDGRLVGRARELSVVQAAIDDAASGRGLIVALVGEPGIGKTRLAVEGRQSAEAAGFFTVWTISRPYSVAFAYQMLAQLTQQLLRRGNGETVLDSLRAHGVTADDPTLAQWAAVISEMLEESTPAAGLTDLSPAGRQRLLVHAIDALLRAAAGERPLFIVFDDLHWADPASLAILEELLDDIPDQRIAVLALYRSGWTHGWEGKSAYQQINLRALRPDEARELALEVADGNGLDEEITERALARAAGNPFFLEELLRPAGHAGHDIGGRLPETIYEILLARLDTLAPAERQTLQLASVVGTEFSYEEIAALGPGEDVARSDADLRALQRAELIVGHTNERGERLLTFRHPLIHEVAYRSLLAGDRKRLHGRIGRWLDERVGADLRAAAERTASEAPALLDSVGMPSRPASGAAGSGDGVPYQHVAALARHYRDGDDLDKAREYLPLAGARAESLNAGWEAKGWYLDAAAAFEGVPGRRAAMLEAAARQTYLVGVSSDANDLMLEAIRMYESAGEAVAALNARRLLGRYYWLQGHWGEADRQFELAITGLERLPPTPELAYAYSFRSQLLMLRPDYEAGELWARKAIAVAEATNATAALVHAYNNLGMCLFHLGDETGQGYVRRSLELALSHGLADDVGRAYANLSGQGNRVFPFGYEAATAFLEEALAYSRRTIPGGAFDQWIHLGAAELAIATGSWAEAEAILDEEDWSRSELYSQTEVAALRSQLASYQGRYDDAAAWSNSTIEGSVKVGDVQAVFPSFMALAHSQLGLGNVGDAVSSLRRALDLGGSRKDEILGCWFMFEGADLLTTASGPSARSGESAPIASGVEALLDFAAAIAPNAGQAGDAVIVETARALFGAALEQLAVLRRVQDGVGSRVEIAGSFPGRQAAIPVLEVQHRVFDAARVRLWLAEESGDPNGLDAAVAVFEERGARPYLARTAALRQA